MEDLWPATTYQSHLQSIGTELRVWAVRELPDEHVSEEQIHDHHQLEESFLRRDVSDISGSDLVRCLDLLEVHQTGKSLGWLAWHRGGWFLADRP